MAAPVETMNPSTEVLDTTVTSVFQPGKLAVELISVDHNTDPTPPIPVLIAAPKDSGTYPVAMLLHGFCLQNHFYEQVLKHIASFGFIMVAPQFHISILGMAKGDTEDIAAAAQVTDWLTKASFCKYHPRSSPMNPPLQHSDAGTRHRHRAGRGEEEHIVPSLCPQRCEPQGVLPRVHATLLLLRHQGLWASGHARR
ncbi:hypothetical protein BDA96_08G110300 [Sorghum bicolor]|uniref:Chlorophyllase n=1 Tax=Sorghum bicolor TaxID=4558 RepID=A0A921U732_SORBI|nr:hypothetical protein BDA96_08G110300 [Sorghum bicolor]